MLRLVLPLALVASILTNAWLYTRWRETGNAAAATQFSTRLPVPDSRSAGEAKPAPTNLEPLRLAGSLSETDLRDLRARLEASGLPPEIVRAALVLSVHFNFQKRRAALMRAQDPSVYWRIPKQTRESSDPEIRELEKEQRRMIREMGGDDFGFMDEDATARQFGALSSEKVARLKKIFADYQDLEEQMFADRTDRGSPENRARSALLAREKRADIERLLTADELRDYDYRNSPGAEHLRSRFGRFEATEAEFLALYPTFKAVSDETLELSLNQKGSQADLRAAREAADKRLDSELQRVLGAQRYAEFKEANDHLLQETRAFTTSLNLPASTAAEVIAIQKEFAPKLNAIDRDRDLSPNQRDSQASDLGLEARERLIRLLGPDNFEAYKRRGGGWLGQALNRRPPTPSPKP